jgi:thiamine biosynthesis lipoprotein
MSKTFIDTQGRALHRHNLAGDTMGTRYGATFFAPDDVDTKVVSKALFTAVDRVDRQMSTWKPDSDLMRLNRVEAGSWVDIPAQLTTVLSTALEIGRRSSGAFDIGLGGLVNAWGFGATGAVPDAQAITERLGKPVPPVYETLEIDAENRKARKLAAVELDLSGIAKGFAVDEMLDCLRSFGVENALVSLDGELKATGLKSPTQPWAVAVEKPNYTAREPLSVIELKQAAVATSGDYRHWVDVGQVRLSHTMDRHAGGPIKNRVASVTVVAPDCIAADAWATALMVLGPDAGQIVARANGLNALFIIRSDKELIQIPAGNIFEKC